MHNLNEATPLSFPQLAQPLTQRESLICNSCSNYLEVKPTKTVLQPARVDEFMLSKPADDEVDSENERASQKRAATVTAEDQERARKRSKCDYILSLSHKDGSQMDSSTPSGISPAPSPGTIL